MSRFLFEIPDIRDPEELLEAAVLWKAMSDVYGERIRAIGRHDPVEPTDLVFGRQRSGSPLGKGPVSLATDYWTLPGFTSALTRDFKLCTLDEARTEVDRLASEGKAAFLKSTRPKFFVGQGEVGDGLSRILGDMVYSFIDNPHPNLLVQERVDFSHEYRFIVADGAIVTGSPVMESLTPAQREFFVKGGVSPENVLFPGRGKKDDAWVNDPDTVGRMRERAAAIAAETCLVSGTVDMGLIRGATEIELIEINPGFPGAYGLYMSDPYAIAEGSGRILSRLEFELADPEPAPEDEEPDWGAIFQNG